MSNFVVSARKYRPARFVDVVGQSHVTNTLKNAFRSDHLAHAFLFTGPRGVGKTTCARILAKVLNCEQPTPDWEACDVCNSCKAFRENASFNVHELDAASNNSVEHIRALIEQVRFQPQQGKYKIYIIDEVHMLSQAAFNAFLKTLEEPPSYAIFILATTEKHKIIPTILSRCQIFDFNRIQIADMSAHLQHICEEENIKAEPDALHIISQKADGALRDALSIFDRIVSYSGNNITYSDVILNLNILDYDYYFKILSALLVEDLPQVWLFFDEILRKGFDAEVFINGLASHIRDILLCKNPATLALLETGEMLQKRYQEQSQIATTGFLLTALNLCNECDVNYKLARDKKLHIQIYLAKICMIGRGVRLAEEKKNPEPSVAAVPSPKIGEKAPITPAPETPKAAYTSYKDSKKIVKEEGSPLDKIKQQVIKEREEQQKGQDASLLTQENLLHYWQEYISTLTSPTTKLILQNSSPMMKGTVVELTVNSNLSKSTVEQENDLWNFLREKMNYLAIKFSITVDAPPPPTEAQIAASRPLNERDKLQLMAADNPTIIDFCKTFNLRMD